MEVTQMMNFFIILSCFTTIFIYSLFFVKYTFKKAKKQLKDFEENNKNYLNKN